MHPATRIVVKVGRFPGGSLEECGFWLVAERERMAAEVAQHIVAAFLSGAAIDKARYRPGIESEQWSEATLREAANLGQRVRQELRDQWRVALGESPGVGKPK